MGRLVKRYGNRKLYDTSESRYVTLDEIGRWVKAGEDVKILENDTGEDLTAVTFAQIILEEERKKSGLLSLRMLREIIQHGEAALQGLAATVDRGMEAIRTAPEQIVAKIRSDGHDLLFIGAYGHSRIVEMVLGSTTEYVLRNAPCPVFLHR